MTYATLIPVILGNLRGWEWLIIFLVVLLLFGGKKIPELMRGLGKGIHSFKQGIQEAKDEIERPVEPKSPKATSENDEPKGKDRD